MRTQRPAHRINSARCRAGLIGLLTLLGVLVAAGAWAGVAQADAPTSYQVSSIDDWSSIACAPSTTTCIAVGDNGSGDNYPNWAVAIDDGVPGTPVPISIAGSQVACTSSTSCVIAGTDGAYESGPGALLPVSIANGAATYGSVEDVANTSSLDGIACPSANKCVADGYDSIDNGSTYVGVIVDVPGGAAGTPDAAQDVSSVDGLGAISCASASQCLAIGTNPAFTGTGSKDMVLPLSSTGSSPGTPEAVNGFNSVDGVACVSGTAMCEVVGYGSNSEGAAVEITGATGETVGTQETVVATPDTLNGVSCPTTAFCVAVGATSGENFSGVAVGFEPGAPISGGTTDPNAGELEAVECQSATSCLELGGDNSNGGDVDNLPVSSPTATLSGTVTLAGSPPTDVTGAPVQACSSDSSFCIDGSSAGSGAYALSVPIGESYVVTAFSPASEDYTEASSPATAAVTASGVSGVGVVLEPAPALQSGVTVTSPDFGTEGSGSTPKVNWGQPFDVHIPASAFPSGEITTVETLVITGTNTSTGLVQSDTVYAGGETTTASGQNAANGLVVGANGVDIPVPPLSPIHGPVSMVVNSFSVPIPPTGVAVGGADPVVFTQGAATQQPSVVATDYGVDHTVGTPTISGADASTFSLNAPTGCAPSSTIVQVSAADPGSDQACSFSVTWTPPANVASPPQPYYYATLNVPVTNSSGQAAQLLVPLLGCDERIVSAGLCHAESAGAGAGTGGGISGAPSVGQPIGSLYVDPSGVVETTTTGGTTVPLDGATVTLLQQGSSGSYSTVPSGSDVMSPANRTNPVTTGEDGSFGWDTLAGTYEITASDSACTNSATSNPETVPPPATGIDLLLDCPGITQSSTVTTLGTDPTIAPPGQAVELTATVSGTDPTGTVTLSDGNTTLVTVPVDSSTGKASYATSALPPGLDTITASYSGDAAHAPSHGQGTVTVQSAAPVATTTAVSATPGTATSGGSVTYSATVTPASGSADPTGTISFTATLGTSSTGLCTATIQGTAATCSAASAPVGPDTITATYSGDTNFSASSGTTTETVAAPPTGAAPTTGGAGTTGPATGTGSATGTGVGISTSTSTGTVTTASVGNQEITLTTPSDKVCVAPSAEAPVKFATAALKGSKQAALTFKLAAFYLDKGVKHSKKVRKRVTKHGKAVTETVTVVSYTANATVKKASDSVSLSLKGLTSGVHTLKVIVSYSETARTKKTVKVDGKAKTETVKNTKTVTKVLTATINVC